MFTKNNVENVEVLLQDIGKMIYAQNAKQSLKKKKKEKRKRKN